MPGTDIDELPIDDFRLPFESAEDNRILIGNRQSEIGNVKTEFSYD